MRLVYFARVREAIGIDTEDFDLPADIETVGECVYWLRARGSQYAAALADLPRLRFALDRQMVDENAPLEGALELAIFPPVTGG